MKKSGYSLRRRTREQSNVSAPGDASNAAAAKATGSKRAALSDVSNQKSAKAGEEKSKATKQTRSTTTRSSRASNADESADGQTKRGRSEAPKGKFTESEKKIRRSSSRIALIKKAAEEIERKKKAEKKLIAKLAAEKEKTAGAKRTSTDNNSQPAGRGRPKRAKTTESKAAPIVIRTRSSSRRRSTALAFERKENIVEIIKEENRIVPIDFRLTRTSFNGHNHTYGIAHYDASNRSDPFECKDYVTDMFQHFYHAETQTHPREYMHEQEDINAKMRAILVDWLVEVHMKFRLVPDTLYLCVNIIDRYCAKVVVSRSKLQLIGVTALLVACKHEEIYPPEVRDCVYITDRAYERHEVLEMEQSIVRVLNWKISVPTAYPFLHRFLSLTQASPMTRHAANYYLERTLQEHEFLNYRPSTVCAAAVILALNNPDIRVREEDYTREFPGLPKILMEYTEFCRNELCSIMKKICARVAEEPITASRRQLTAVKRKYDNKKYLSVSTDIQLPSLQHVLEHTPVGESPLVF